MRSYPSCPVISRVISDIYNKYRVRGRIVDDEMRERADNFDVEKTLKDAIESRKKLGMV